MGHVLLRTAALRHRDGTPLGMALILGDVTEVTTLRQQMSGRTRLGRLVGRDPKMQELFALITDVAGSDATVLIRGESGTGKELVARAIHEGSGRSDGPFVQVNCSALAETLLESELFGHVKGAYTGAVADRRGRFEEAAGGTLFLDEIGDVSPVVQVKLLRVLQERVIERVGDNRPVPVDVRVVSATNRDLDHLLASGRLREDFFYRIKVVSLTIPPLRDRREDIPLLITHLLQRIAEREGLDGAAAGHGRGPEPAHAPRLAGQRARAGERPGARGGAQPGRTDPGPAPAAGGGRRPRGRAAEPAGGAPPQRVRAAGAGRGPGRRRLEPHPGRAPTGY